MSAREPFISPRVEYRPGLARQMVIRVEQSLYDALTRDAAANGRTIAQSVRHLLRQALVDQKDDQG